MRVRAAELSLKNGEACMRFEPAWESSLPFSICGQRYPERFGPPQIRPGGSKYFRGVLLNRRTADKHRAALLPCPARARLKSANYLAAQGSDANPGGLNDDWIPK